EVAGGGEGVDQLSRGGGLIGIDHEGGGVPHVGRHRVAEGDELEQRRHEKDAAHPHVTEDLAEFLADHLVDALEFRADAHPSSFRKRATASASPPAAKAAI